MRLGGRLAVDRERDEQQTNEHGRGSASDQVEVDPRFRFGEEHSPVPRFV
jgi:hypothetical protein